MGACDFYISLKIEEDAANQLLKTYSRNELYKSAFYYGIAVEQVENKYIAGISSVIDSFLPACSLIFQFLLTGIGENPHFYVKTRDVEQLFDFEKKADFINFMYNAWEEKIDMYYMRMGGLLLDQRNYYEARRKLFKKYYKKF